MSHELERAYARAVYRFVSRGRPVALRFDDAALPDAEPSLLLPSGDWAILTAFNPGHARLGDAENAERHERLRRLVEAGGYPHAPSESSDEIGNHREPGLLVHDVPRDDVLAIARAFDQHAAVFGQGPVCGLLFTASGRWRVLPARVTPEHPP